MLSRLMPDSPRAKLHDPHHVSVGEQIGPEEDRAGAAKLHRADYA